MSEKEFEYPTVEELVEGVEEDRGNMATLLGKLNDKSMQQFNFPGMRMLPVILSPQSRSRYTDGVLREHDALLKFFHDKHGDQSIIPSMWVYEGFVGELHAKFVRFSVSDTVNFTYLTEPRNYDRVINVLSGGEDEEGLQVDHLMFRNKRYWQVGHPNGIPMAIAAPIELPMSCYACPFESELDSLFDGDFTHLEEIKERFSVKFREYLHKATELAQKVGYLIYEKNHDLILSFKGVDKITKLNIGLDRVYPLLPESGEIEVGDKVLTTNDWKDYATNIQVSVKRIITLNKYVNRSIEGFRNMLAQHPFILKQWDEHVKTELMASSHFLKVIYSAQPEYVHGLVMEVANEVLTTLHEHGGNIGLDLNDWTVYSYDGIGRPKPLVTPEMKFADKLYKRYTDSFISALYAYLLRCQSPLIKPYTYREVVSVDDGIAVGTVRQVN